MHIFDKLRVWTAESRAAAQANRQANLAELQRIAPDVLELRRQLQEAEDALQEEKAKPRNQKNKDRQRDLEHQLRSAKKRYAKVFLPLLSTSTWHGREAELVRLIEKHTARRDGSNKSK